MRLCSPDLKRDVERGCSKFYGIKVKLVRSIFYESIERKTG